MTGDEAVARARALFLAEGNAYGCAETAFVVCKEAFGVPDADDPSAAMALNGGIAHSGGTCGALTGAALALGMLAGRRCADHAAAKRLARERVAATMAAFRGAHGVLDCRTLIGRDISTPEGHAAFIESGVWRDACMARIEWVVRALAGVPYERGWEEGREPAFR